VREGVPEVPHPGRGDRQRATATRPAGSAAAQAQVQLALPGGHPLRAAAVTPPARHRRAPSRSARCPATPAATSTRSVPPSRPDGVFTARVRGHGPTYESPISAQIPPSTAPKPQVNAGHPGQQQNATQVRSSLDRGRRTSHYLALLFGGLPRSCSLPSPRQKVWAGRRPERPLRSFALLCHPDSYHRAGIRQVVGRAAAATYKHSYGFHPILVTCDNTGKGWLSGCGRATRREHRRRSPTSWPRRSRRSWTPRSAADSRRQRRRDPCGAGLAHDQNSRRRRVEYSVGWALGEPERAAITAAQVGVVTGAGRRRRRRDGADVAELTGLLPLPGWPAGIRVIVRRELPHSGAQLSFEERHG
jgi:hypothetical protein